MSAPPAHDGAARADDAGEARPLEARYRAAFHGASTGMHLVDADGRILDHNDVLAGILGYGPDELRGAHLSLFVDPDELPAAMAALRDLVAGRRDRYHAERNYRCKDGRLRQMLVHVTAVRDAGGAFQFMLSEVEDVSERRALEAQLLFADRMSALGTLAAGVAHEINNPLAFILSNLAYALEELQRTGTGPAEVLRALEEAREGSVRVREIVRDLKTFSRPEDRPDEAVDLRAVLRSAINLAANEIRHRARLEDDLPAVPQVMGSAHRLGQVFLNLLINAAQAIPEGRADQNVIRVACRAEGPRVVVEISDTGSGILPEHLPRIFEPFFTTKPVGVGTGLGLSVCHGIVVGLGGEITVDSRPGATTFRVTLPSLVAGAQPLAPDEAQGRRARILIVDDEPMVARALARTLAAHEVAIVHGGSEALDRLRQDAGYDVIVCDLLMPDLDGMELHERLQVEWPGLCDRMVFMTGGAATERARAFLAEVGNPRLQKPFEPAGLRALVDALVRARR